MEKQRIEDRIKNMYEEEAVKLQLPDNVKLQIDDRIKEIEDKKTVRVWGKKRIVILLAATMLLISSIGCYALGIGAAKSTIGYANAFPDTTDFADVPKMVKKAGFSFQAVEYFSNGYSFQGLTVATLGDYDENGQKLGEEYHSLKFDYANGDKMLVLNIYPIRGEFLPPQNLIEAKEIEGNQAYFTKYVSKVVPQDYQMTEEDKKREQQGGFSVSSADGQETIEEKTSYSLNWQENKIDYQITDYVGNVSFHEMEEMASEIMNGEE